MDGIASIAGTFHTTHHCICASLINSAVPSYIQRISWVMSKHLTVLYYTPSACGIAVHKKYCNT